LKARNYQVGGNHYSKMRIQPFEFTAANDLGGIEHTIVKYVSRWREKGGVDDIRKSRHSLEFLIESAPGLVAIRESRAPFDPAITADQYCTANELGPLEAEVVRRIYFWAHNRQVSGLYRCGEHLDRLIAEVTA
tara:strand:+ start:78846 stop:79247 length:402 start_codon:yes stop_codon:yes gene_type:complete